MLDYAWSGAPTLAPDGPQEPPKHDGSSMVMLGMGGGGGGSQGGDPSGGNWQTASAGPMGAQMQLEILTDKPHIAVKQPDKDPEFQPQTNYGWFSNDKIAELEQHIAAMREKRQKLAQEAEVVWAWLAEKEAEFLEKYPVTKKREEGDEKPSDAALQSSMLVQSLGQVHASIWREASACDWIIVSSKQKITMYTQQTNIVTFRPTPKNESHKKNPSPLTEKSNGDLPAPKQLPPHH